tara:strand:- start:1049 stop:1315 length:267 start_codon:yes stop_codon:yes gene_type:complete
MQSINQKDMTVELLVKLNLTDADLQVHDLQVDDNYETLDLPSNIVKAVRSEITSWLEDLGFEVEIITKRVNKGHKDITSDVVFTKRGK